LRGHGHQFGALLFQHFSDTKVRVDDVNEAIAPLLEQLNVKAFQKLPGSRASAFAQLDAPAQNQSFAGDNQSMNVGIGVVAFLFSHDR
jgi:hypothetical protein